MQQLFDLKSHFSKNKYKQCSCDVMVNRMHNAQSLFDFVHSSVA